MRRKLEYTELGLWAKTTMAELNMTQAELAESLNVASATLTNIFTGKIKRSPLKEEVKSYLLAEVKKRDKEKAM